MEKTEINVKDLLAKAEQEIDKKYKTREELEEAYAKVLVMTQVYDKALNRMRNAALDLEDGDITKADFYRVIREQKKIIKEPAQLLMVHLGKEFNKEDEITMADTQAFREYARGLDRIFKVRLKNAAKVEVNPTLADKIEEAHESMYSLDKTFEDDIVMEGYVSDDIYPDHTKQELKAFASVCESLKVKPNEDWIPQKLRESKANLYEAWGKDRDHNVLYITGYSGSGKSKVTERLKDSNTVVIHLDAYFDEYINPNAGGKSKYFNEYLEDHDIPAPNSLNDREKSDMDVYRKFEKAIEDFGKLQFDEGRKVIVEGTQILDGIINPNKSFYRNKCIIILQTSQSQSKANAAKRDKDEAEELAKQIINKHQNPTEQKKNMKELEDSSNAETGSVEIDSASESIATNKVKVKAANLDRWGKTPDTNILYITGHSGSGKSTLANKIAAESSDDLIVVHLDTYFDIYEDEREPKKNSSEFNEYLAKHNVISPNEISLSEWGKNKILDKFEDAAVAFGKYQFSKGKKVIFEGIQIMDSGFIMDKSFFKGKPVIIVQTNMITSTARASHRDGETTIKRMIRNRDTMGYSMKSRKEFEDITGANVKII